MPNAGRRPARSTHAYFAIVDYHCAVPGYPLLQLNRKLRGMKMHKAQRSVWVPRVCLRRGRQPHASIVELG